MEIISSTPYPVLLKLIKFKFFIIWSSTPYPVLLKLIKFKLFEVVHHTRFC